MKLLEKPLKKRYRYRLYPDVKQQEALNKVFGCVRYVYNRMLGENKAAYPTWLLSGNTIPLKYPSHFDMNMQLPLWKQEPDKAWLKEVNSQSLQVSLGHLADAYKNAFKHKRGLPKFKSKYSQQSAEYSNQMYSVVDDKLRLGKISTPLKVKWDRTLPSKGVTACTITKTPSGQYYASFVVEVPRTTTTGQGILGIDAGLTDLFTLSDGKIIRNPRHFVRSQRKLARLQRRHSKKKKGSKNREKARLQVARCHQHTTNQRKDHLHKLSTKLIRENQAISMENLKVSNMVQNPKLSKHIHDAGWGMFKRMVMQKVSQNDGCKLYLADPYYPSTQLCNCCGKRPVERIKLGVKHWTCLHCLTVHQRDVNAAQNLKLLAELHHSVCKDTVSENIILTTKAGLLV